MGFPWKKHIAICAVREGITYSFYKGQIITFQDNFKYLGDVTFFVYFNFETTSGDSVFFLPEIVPSELLSNLFISSVPKPRYDCYFSKFTKDS